MLIYLIPFVICLALTTIPMLIQLLVCISTENLWIRLIPVFISAGLCAVWAYLIADGYFPTAFMIGNAIDWILWQCMSAALIIAHGVPFLILGCKSKHSANKLGDFLTNPPVTTIMASENYLK